MKSLVKTATISIIFHLICITLYAQSNVGGFPLVLTTKHQLKSNASPNEDFPTICMPNIENNDVLQEIEEQRKLKKACGNKFAHQFETNISLKEQGDLSEDELILYEGLGREFISLIENDFGCNLKSKAPPPTNGSQYFFTT